MQIFRVRRPGQLRDCFLKQLRRAAVPRAHLLNFYTGVIRSVGYWNTPPRPVLEQLDLESTNSPNRINTKASSQNHLKVKEAKVGFLYSAIYAVPDVATNRALQSQ